MQKVFAHNFCPVKYPLGTKILLLFLICGAYRMSSSEKFVKQQLKEQFDAVLGRRFVLCTPSYDRCRSFVDRQRNVLRTPILAFVRTRETPRH